MDERAVLLVANRSHCCTVGRLQEDDGGGEEQAGGFCCCSHHNKNLPEVVGAAPLMNALRPLYEFVGV